MVCGLSFSRSQSDSGGFSLGTAPVFLPHQNRLSVNYIRLREDTLDRDNLWYPSLSFNEMNKVAIIIIKLRFFSDNCLLKSFIGIPIQILIFLLAFSHTELGVPVDFGVLENDSA